MEITPGSGAKDVVRVIQSILDVEQLHMGQEYFKSLVKNVATHLGVKFCFIGRPVPPSHTTVQTEAVWAGNQFADNFVYDLNGTPCERVLDGRRIGYFSPHVADRFPEDKMLVDMGVESYIGAPVLDDKGELLGLIAILDAKPLAEEEFYCAVMELLAGRLAAELERYDLQENLKRQVTERTEELARANAEINALNERLKQENLRMGAELDVARRLQQMVLPRDTELQALPDLDVACYMKPADEVGGDYYDVLHHSDGRTLLAIGDVTGHGLESGVVMLMTQTGVRSLFDAGIKDLQCFLHLLNATIHANIQRLDTDKNLTFCLLEHHQGKVRICGQHEEVLIVRRDGKIERMDTVDLGYFIGFQPDIGEYTQVASVDLAPDDGIVLYTDGLPEARNAERALYGLEQLCDSIRGHWNQPAAEVCQAVIADLNQHTGSESLYDDVSLMVVKQK